MLILQVFEEDQLVVHRHTDGRELRWKILKMVRSLFVMDGCNTASKLDCSAMHLQEANPFPKPGQSSFARPLVTHFAKSA